MKKYLTNKKGFTLMEVLVASSIFAVVLIFVTGAVAQSSNYQARLKALHQASEESRRIADLITEEVKKANSSIVINNIRTCSSATSGNYSFKNGVLVLTYQEGVGYCLNNETPDKINAPTYPNTFLILSDQNNYKVYYSAPITNDGKSFTGLFYKEFPHITGGELTLAQLDQIRNVSMTNLISKDFLNVTTMFGGVMLDDKSTDRLQAVVKFSVDIESLENSGYNTASAFVESAVTSRSYNI